jgi:hypothetical protein
MAHGQNKRFLLFVSWLSPAVKIVFIKMLFVLGNE